MMSQWPVIIVMSPFFAGLIAAILGLYKKSLTLPTVIIGLIISVIAALKTASLVVANGPLRYKLAGWSYEKFPVGIEYNIDHLNITVLVMITVVALLVAIFSKHSIIKECPENLVSFYVLFSLLITGLTGITITDDAFNLYVMIEIAALSSYALIAFGKARAYLATFNYLIMGSIGACFYLLGVGYVF